MSDVIGVSCIAKSVIAALTLGYGSQSSSALPNDSRDYFSADYREARQKF